MNFNVTIVIPARNEAKNLRRGIPLCSKLGHVLVVDSSSTDETVVVSHELGAEVIKFKWDGQFPKKRNWTLHNYDFQTEWVLFLDADEFVTDAFIAEVKSSISHTSHDGFWLRFDDHFMSRRIRYGVPFRKLALFRVGAGEYERIDEDNWSHLDMEVHEHPVLQGTTGEIQSPIEHNDFRGIKHYITKHNEYSSWEVARYFRLLDEQGAEWDGMTQRQKIKYHNLDKWWWAPAYLIMNFFLRGGFLDGSDGLNFALMKFFYFYQIRLKIIERRTILEDQKVD